MSFATLSRRTALPLPRRFRPLLLLAAALLLYVPLLGRRDIVTGHEARVAQTAREMARTWPWQQADADRLHVQRVVLTDLGGGVLRLYPATDGSTVAVNPWLVPVLQGLIRLQKPPLPYWCAAVLLKLFAAGNIGQGWARLVPALMGAVSILFIHDLGRLTIGRAGAWAAGLVWLSSYLPFEEYRLAMPDPYLAFFTLVCVWAWVWAGSAPERSSRAVVILLFYLSLALGALAKGPLILLHVGIALAAFQACYRRGAPGRAWQHLLGISLMIAVAAPWFVYVCRQVPDAVALWRYESVGEMAGNRENVRPWWFYVPAALLISVPWTPAWAAGLAWPIMRFRRRRGRQDREALFPIAWYLATLAFFSLVHQKKNPYLLPVMPAQVLLIARALVALLAHARLTWARGGAALRRGRSDPRRAPLEHRVDELCAQSQPDYRRDDAGYLLGAQPILGVAGSVAAIVVIAHENSGGAGAIVAIGIAGLVAGWLPLWLLLRRTPKWLSVQAVAYAVLVLLVFEGIITPRDNRRSARRVCEVAAPMLQRPGTTLLLDVLAEEAAVYLPMGIDYGPGHRVLVLFDDQDGVNLRKKAVKYAGYVPGPVPAGDGPVDEKYLRRWDTWIGGGRVVDARRIVVPGAIGDVRWKLFALNVDRKILAVDGFSR